MLKNCRKKIEKFLKNVEKMLMCGCEVRACDPKNGRNSHLVKDIVSFLSGNDAYPFLHFSKGQLISKCPFGVFESSKKQQNFCKDFWLSALASKKRSNQKSSVRESK